MGTREGRGGCIVEGRTGNEEGRRGKVRREQARVHKDAPRLVGFNLCYKSNWVKAMTGLFFSHPAHTLHARSD